MELIFNSDDSRKCIPLLRFAINKETGIDAIQFNEKEEIIGTTRFNRNQMWLLGKIRKTIFIKNIGVFITGFIEVSAGFKHSVH
jgi:hypothetical protein